MINDTKPRVSIIIPTYNRAEYLDETITSARAQTYDHLDIFILDDASEDHTPEVVKAHQREDGRIRYVRHLANKGLVGNWRYGIDNAEGEYFCILGDDDTLEPDFIEELIEPLLADDDLAFAFSDHWIMDEDGIRMPKKSVENAERWRRSLLSEGRVDDVERVTIVNRSVFIGSVLFRRSAISGFLVEDEVTSFIDAWLLYGASRKGTAYYVPKRLVNCRWQEGGVSRSRKWRVYGYEGEIYYYRRLLEDGSLRRFHKIFRVRLAEALAGLGNTCLLLGERKRARTSFREAQSLHPSFKAYVGHVLTYGGPISTSCLIALRSLRNYFLPPSRPPIYPESKLLELGSENGNGSLLTSQASEKTLERVSA